jgi:hypothetical protein
MLNGKLWLSRTILDPCARLKRPRRIRIEIYCAVNQCNRRSRVAAKLDMQVRAAREYELILLCELERSFLETLSDYNFALPIIGPILHPALCMDVSEADQRSGVVRIEFNGSRKQAMRLACSPEPIPV